MKMSRKIAIAIVLALVVCMIVAPAAHAVSNGWAWQQETAHQIAELARSLGLPENHPLIVICQDIWWAYHDGTDPTKIGSYTSVRTGQTYGTNSSGVAYTYGQDIATGLAYRYNGYTWYQSKINFQAFFRIEGTKLVWATNTQNGQIPQYGSYISSWEYPADGYYTNLIDSDISKLEVYNNGTSSRYGGKELYRGVITGIDQYVDSNKALALAKLMYGGGYNEKSMAKVAAIGWSAVDYIGVDNLSAYTLQNTYSGLYRDDAPTVDQNGRDYLALAKDILYRKLAEKAGMTYVGRVLPTSYSYIWCEDGAPSFYTGPNKTYIYNFPYVGTSNSQLYSPYYN